MARNRPTHRDVLSLLTGAWVHLGRSLAAICGFASLGIAALQQDPSWFQVALICAFVWVFFAFFHAFECARSRCALCTGSLFKRSSNVKHVTARRFLGSYELWTALQTIFTVSYRCQHCGTRVFCHRAEKREKVGPTRRAYLRHGRIPRAQNKSEIVLQARVRIPPRRQPPPQAPPAADPPARS